MLATKALYTVSSISTPVLGGVLFLGRFKYYVPSILPSATYRNYYAIFIRGSANDYCTNHASLAMEYMYTFIGLNNLN